MIDHDHDHDHDPPATADHRLAALEVAAMLRQAADLALVADRAALRRAITYIRRVVLELNDTTGGR